MTLELVPWRGAKVPLLAQGEISRFTTQDYLNWITWSQGYMDPPAPVTTYGSRPAEPISYSFQGFVEGMLYADGPVAAAEAYRLRVFGQAPLLYQEMVDGRAGDMFDDAALDRIRTPWAGATLSDLMKRALVYGDFAGNAFVLDLDDELVLVRPDWVEIVLAKREHRGGQVGWRQVGIVYYEGGLRTSDGVAFLPGEYAHFVPGLPDPLATYRGMSWLTPLVREVKADKSAGDHKVAFFENAASPNLAVSLPKELTPSQFNDFVDKMDAQHRGAFNAYKTLYTGGGADVTVIGANMQQMDFAAVQGKGETRIANAAGVPPTLLSFSEGMQGSSLNAGNYTAAKRNFVDTTMRDLWQNFAGSVQQMDAFRPPRERSRLWYDGRDIPFLHEDALDLANIQQTRGATINAYVINGWKPETAIAAVAQDDVLVLEHTGAYSVQLQPAGSGDLNGDGQPDAQTQAADQYQQALESLRAEVDEHLDDITRGHPHPGQKYRHGWIPIGGGLVAALGADVPDVWDEKNVDEAPQLGRIAHDLFDYHHGPTGLAASVEDEISTAWRTPDEPILKVEGTVRDPRGEIVGGFRRVLHPEQGWVHNDSFALDDKYQRQGFATAFNAAAEAKLVQNGFTRATVSPAGSVGGYAWARSGYTWDPAKVAPQGDVPTRMWSALSGTDLTAGQRTQLTDWLHAFTEQPRNQWPTPAAIAEFGEVGRAIMAGAAWSGEKRLSVQRSYELDDDEIERKYYDVRVPKGFEGGGRFRSLSDRIGHALNQWLSGDSEHDDPLAGFNREQLRKASVEFGVTPRRGASAEEIKLGLLTDARSRFRGGKDAKSPEAGKPVRFTLAGKDHRNLDVGVYTDNGKVALWEVSDSGERRKRVALVDNLAGLAAWADEHGESELAGWARKERGGAGAPKVPTKAAPAAKAEPSPLAKEASAILANSNGSTYELDALLGGRSKRQLQGIADHLGIESQGNPTAVQLRERIAQELMPDGGRKPTGRFDVMRLNDILTNMSEPDVALESGHSHGARAGWTDVVSASPGKASTATAAQRDALHEYKSDERYRELDYNATDPTITGVRSAMEPLESDVVVWRGERSLNTKVPRGTWSRKGGMEGVEWTGRSFTSTSADESVARDFATNDDGSVPGSQPVLMRVRAPAGTRAVAVDSVLQRQGPDDISSYLKEQELLLADGLNYRITKDYGVVRGVRRLDVEVTPPKPAPAKVAKKAAPNSAGASGKPSRTDLATRLADEPGLHPLAARDIRESKGNTQTLRARADAHDSMAVATEGNPALANPALGLTPTGYREMARQLRSAADRIDAQSAPPREKRTFPDRPDLTAGQIQQRRVDAGFSSQPTEADVDAALDRLSRPELVELSDRLNLSEDGRRRRVGGGVESIKGWSADQLKRAIREESLGHSRRTTGATDNGAADIVDTSLDIRPAAAKAAGTDANAEAKREADAQAPDLASLDTEHRRDALDLRKVDELKMVLRESGLPVSGRKRDLVDRLVEHLGGGASNAPSTKAASKSSAGRAPAKPVPIHDLFKPETSDATIQAALKDVFEGKFGPYTTKADVSVTRAGTRIDKRGREHKIEPSISIGGKIYDEQGHEIGYFGRNISPVNMHYVDGTVHREVWAEHKIVQLGGGDYDANPTKYHGKGFGGEFNRRAIEWYRQSGVHGISQSDHNGYVWASQGFNFGQGGGVPDYLADNIRQLIADLRAGKTKTNAAKDEYHTIPKRFREAPDLDAQIAETETLLARLESTKPGEPDYPTAYEISQLGRRSGQRGKTALWLGKLLWVSADQMILNPDEGEVVNP